MNKRDKKIWNKPYNKKKAASTVIPSKIENFNKSISIMDLAIKQVEKRYGSSLGKKSSNN